MKPVLFAFASPLKLRETEAWGLWGCLGLRAAVRRVAVDFPQRAAWPRLLAFSPSFIAAALPLCDPARATRPFSAVSEDIGQLKGRNCTRNGRAHATFGFTLTAAVAAHLRPPRRRGAPETPQPQRLSPEGSTGPPRTEKRACAPDAQRNRPRRPPTPFFRRPSSRTALAQGRAQRREKHTHGDANQPSSLWRHHQRGRLGRRARRQEAAQVGAQGRRCRRAGRLEPPGRHRVRE